MKKNKASVRKVVLTGPESSGKTTLAQSLAATHQTVWVPEYARSMGESLNRPFRAEDIPHIAAQQRAWEEKAVESATTWLFCDTGPVVLRVWEEVKFGQCSEAVESWLLTSDHFLFLLCRPDLRWEPDPLREDPNNRDQLFTRYLEILQTYQLPYVVIEGEKRLQRCLHHLTP